MPNRIIKEDAFTSDRIAALSDFEFRLWVGLITQADDAGRGDARPAIIKGRVFALRERTTISDIDKALHALAAHGCVFLYEVDGKPYFEFPSWAKHQRIRDVKSKFPPCGDLRQSAASCGELPQTAALIQSNPIQSESESESKSESNTTPFASAAMNDAFAEWLKYKKERRQAYKQTGLQQLINRLNDDIKSHGEKAVIEGIHNSMAQGWSGIYLKDNKTGQPAKQSSNASYDIEKAEHKMNTTVPKLKKKEGRKINGN